MKRYLSILSAVCLPAVISASAYTGSMVPPEGCVPFEAGPAANSEELILSTAKYSHSELVSIMDDILQYLKRSQAKADDGFFIVSCRIDDQNGRVVVGSTDISDACIASFKEKVCDSPAVSFELADTSEQMDLVSPGRSFQGLE